MMRREPFQPPKLSPERTDEIDARWTKAVEYFKSRGAVIFSSYCRFWEQHAFVQQSLARALALAGVEVVWLDGAGWRRYQPLVGVPSPRLQVRQLPQLPGRRVPWVAELNIAWQRDHLRRLFRAKGGKPVFWVHGGIDERLASAVPYVDVFSVFDDPYRHTPMGELCRKSRVILTQNEQAKRMLESLHAHKLHLALPPVDLAPGTFDEAGKLPWPEDFPEKVMGYVGSYFYEGFDLNLFEDFLHAFPDHGFVLMGRTDAAGAAFVQRFRRRPNFLALPWMPRGQTAAVWRKLDLSLLFYRPNRSQDGAFPVKVLESLHFGVPVIATQTPKTEGLEGYFPRSPFADALKTHARQELGADPARLGATYAHFVYEMNPRLHLARVAEWLQR